MPISLLKYLWPRCVTSLSCCYHRSWFLRTDELSGWLLAEGLPGAKPYVVCVALPQEQPVLGVALVLHCSDVCC